MQAEELRPGQAIEVEGRRYTVALADRSPAGTIRIVPHNPDEARSGR